MISVIIATYCQEAHVEQTVRSMLDQQVDTDVQIIISDDGSTDGTPDVLRRLKDEVGDRITLLLNPDNAGITGNCNRALAHATGDYLAYIGGDDIALPGRLQRPLDALRARPEAGACIAVAEAFDSDTGAVLRTIDPVQTHGKRTFTARDYLVRGHVGATPAYMYRRAKTPGRFDPRIPMASDSVYNVEVAYRSEVFAIPDVLVRYRVHGNSSSSIGPGADRFLAEAVIASSHPDLVPYLRHWRAWAYRTEALRHLVAGRTAEARPYFAESLRARPNLRSLAGLGLCSLPEGLTKRVLYRYNPMLKKRYG